MNSFENDIRYFFKGKGIIFFYLVSDSLYLSKEIITGSQPAQEWIESLVDGFPDPINKPASFKFVSQFAISFVELTLCLTF